MVYSAEKSGYSAVSADNFVNIISITLLFACNCCVSRASCLLSVVRTGTSDWSVSKSIITKCLVIRRFVVIALNVKFTSLYMYLSGIAVSGLMLRLKAKKLADNPEFKASLGWYHN